MNELEDDPTSGAGSSPGTATVFSAGADLSAGTGQPTERGGRGRASSGGSAPNRSSPRSRATRSAAAWSWSSRATWSSRRPTAMFGLPEVKRGLMADYGGPFRVMRALPPNVAREMLLTGDWLTAERAERLGFVNVLTEPGGRATGGGRAGRTHLRQRPAGGAGVARARQRGVRGGGGRRVGVERPPRTGRWSTPRTAPRASPPSSSAARPSGRIADSATRPRPGHGGRDDRTTAARVGRLPRRAAARTGARRTSTPRSATRSTRGCATRTARARRSADHTGQAVYGDEALEDFGALDAVNEGGVDGAWDSARRLAELDADGIAAEVIYPGGGGDSISPFDAGLMTYQYDEDPAVWDAGCRAYNRWLADFCNDAAWPAGRRRARSPSTTSTRPSARSTRCATAAIFGGILLPSGTGRQRAVQPPALRAALGGVRGERSAGAHAQRLDAELRRLPRFARHLHHRDHVVRAPRVLAPRVVGRLRASSRAPHGDDRAGRDVGARDAPADGRRLRDADVPAPATGAAPRAVGVLRAPVLHLAVPRARRDAGPPAASASTS